ncbi:MAG: hypothetical protein AAGB29_12085 [Planctomycetota bacterium]
MDTDAVLALNKTRESPLIVDPAIYAKKLGLGPEIASRADLGGEEISIESRVHPGHRVRIGDWDTGFSSDCIAIQHATGISIYDIFPEASEHSWLVKPDWLAARERLVETKQKFEATGYEWLVSQHSNEQLAAEEYEGTLKTIDVMIETIDYVIQSSSDEYLLDWSA